MTMSNNDEDQPDELEQQQQQQQPTLPLLYLPIELAEEVSSYFEGWSAAKLLRVSCSFHNLFLPRVWIYLDTFTIIEDEQARQRMLEKYGHFVRSINFVDDIVSELNFDWLPFVKRAVHIKTKIYNTFSAEEAEMLVKLIKQSKELRVLDLHFATYGARINFDELAAAINELKYLERIKCQFGNDSGVWDRGNEWKRAIDLVELLHPSARSKLRMRMNFDKFSDDVDVQALAPYIVKLVGFVNVACTKPFVHEFFGVCDNDGQLLAFPQLKELSMTSCCFDIEEYDVNSIKASRFPQLQSLYFRSKPCNSENLGRQSENEHETYNWKPEYSGYPHVIVSSQRWECLT
ncbi:hypothetical protein GQ42DRAFT_30417 [Ramicandelaber brevisporus]|nr:hypothetical protein GQ42DRAFT_30417 [Ramicandelaber brevisporus]